MLPLAVRCVAVPEEDAQKACSTCPLPESTWLVGRRPPLPLLGPDSGRASDRGDRPCDIRAAAARLTGSMVRQDHHRTLANCERATCQPEGAHFFIWCRQPTTGASSATTTLRHPSEFLRNVPCAAGHVFADKTAHGVPKPDLHCIRVSTTQLTTTSRSVGPPHFAANPPHDAGCDSAVVDPAVVRAIAEAIIARAGSVASRCKRLLLLGGFNRVKVMLSLTSAQLCAGTTHGRIVYNRTTRAAATASCHLSDMHLRGTRGAIRLRPCEPTPAWPTLPPPMLSALQQDG